MKPLAFATALCMAAAAAATAVSAAVEKDTPKIPCTFSCGYTEEMVYRLSAGQMKRRRSPAPYSNLVRGESSTTNFGDYKYEFNWYNIEGKRMSQDGIEPQTDNTSIIWETPNIVTTVGPFFDRYTCGTFPNQYVRGKCPYFQPKAKFHSTDACPYNTSERCDIFIYMSPDYGTAVNGYFFKDTNIPHCINIETEDYSLTEIFKNFVAETPDESHFKPPKNVQCTVIVDKDGSANPITGDASDDYINSPDNIKRIQAAAHTWKAGYSKAFAGMTRSEVAAKLFPVIPRHTPRAGRVSSSGSGYTKASFAGFGSASVPVEYDARKRYAKCNIETIRDQASCGSCWAFGAVEALEDRVCIHSGANASVVLSPQYLVSCDKNNEGCNGGYLDQAWYGLRDVGTCTEECFSYKAKGVKCPYACEDGSSMKKYRSVDAYSVFIPFEYEKNMMLIQEEIYKNGPVEAA